MGVHVIFNITLSSEDLEVVGQGLDELRFKIAAPVAGRIQAQINAQLVASKAAVEIPAPEPPPPTEALPEGT